MSSATRNPDRRLNVALVGCGRIGEREATALMAQPPLRLVAVSDVGPGFREKAIKMGERCGCDAVQHWQQLVTRDDLDLVILSTPTSVHRDIAVELDASSVALPKSDPSWRLQLAELVAAINDDREPTPNGHDGLQGVRMAEAVCRGAAGAGTPIDAPALAGLRDA